MKRGIISFTLIIFSFLPAGCAGNIPIAPLITRQNNTNLQTADLQTASVPADIPASPSTESSNQPTLNQTPGNVLTETTPEPVNINPVPPPGAVTKSESKLSELKKYFKNNIPSRKRKF